MQALTLILETPNTEVGHRFFVLPDSNVNAGDAARICNRVVQPGLTLYEDTVAVAQPMSQVAMGSGRTGLAKAVVLGFGPLPEGIVAEIEAKLCDLLRSSSSLAAKTSRHKLERELVIESPELIPFIDPSWSRYSRATFARQSTRRQLRRLGFFAGVVVVGFSGAYVITAYRSREPAPSIEESPARGPDALSVQAPSKHLEDPAGLVMVQVAGDGLVLQAGPQLRTVESINISGEGSTTFELPLSEVRQYKPYQLQFIDPQLARAGGAGASVRLALQASGASANSFMLVGGDGNHVAVKISLNGVASEHAAQALADLKSRFEAVSKGPTGR